MFEQSTLTNGPAGKRAWATFFGLTTQTVLVGIAITLPMLWPQVLPLAKLEINLAPPLPPGRRTADEVKKIPEHARVVKAMPLSLATYQPNFVPRSVARIIEEAPAEFAVAGGMGPAGLGAPDGVMTGVLQDLAREAARPVPPPVIEKPVVKPVIEAPKAIQRYTEGGRVHLGLVLHRSEPLYPAMAKSARVSGAVVLECVVGTDGRIHEVKVKSGNPLLVKAAVDAAWGWAYEPSQLNGVPIEIVTILTFNFRLN